MTLDGYLDLTQIPDLYLAGAGLFLKKLRLKNQLLQKDIAKLAGVSSVQVSRWENNGSKISLRALVKIAETLDVSRTKIYERFDKGEFLTKNNLPAKFDTIREIIPYLVPHNFIGSWHVYLKKSSNKTLQLIRDTLNLKMHFRSKGNNNNRALMTSKELHTYLTTFFRYIKIAKIQPPLTSEVKLWHENDVDLKQAIICPCLQSDGSIDKQKHMITFYGLNKVLHDYFVDAMYYEYNELPSSSFLYNIADNIYSTIYCKKAAKAIINEIMKLAGNSKPSPARGQTVEEYLKEQQPHFNYLLDATETEQQIALRIWMSTEGCVSIGKSKGDLYPILELACAHPILTTQLMQIAKRHNLNFTLKRSKKQWSGLSGLFNASLSTNMEFLKLGGFIKGVKISSNSPYHEGVDKDILTLGILEYIRQRKMTNKWKKKLPIDVHHHNVNKIIRNREFNSADYYIRHSGDLWLK